MAKRVADEIGDDDIEPAPIQAHGQPGGHGSPHVLPSPRPQAHADSIGDVGLVGHEPGGAGVEAGDLYQVIHQPVQVEYLLADQPRCGRCVPGQSGVLAKHIGHRGHRGERRSQLLGYVAGELPCPCLHPLQLADLVLKHGRHLVERGDQPGEFVPAPGFDPDRQVTAGHPSGGLRQPPYRQEHPLGRGERQAGDHDQQQRNGGKEEAGSGQ